MSYSTTRFKQRGFSTRLTLQVSELAPEPKTKTLRTVLASSSMSQTVLRSALVGPSGPPGAGSVWQQIAW